MKAKVRGQKDGRFCAPRAPQHSTGIPMAFVPGAQVVLPPSSQAEIRGSKFQACSEPENVLDFTALPHSAALCLYRAGTLPQPTQEALPGL